MYCASGGRSTLAALSLQQLGYSAVRSLHGGFLGWTAAGLPVAF
ncbi:rhodanese-like domain-containing protein [Xanthomonas translucens]